MSSAGLWFVWFSGGTSGWEKITLREVRNTQSCLHLELKSTAPAAFYERTKLSVAAALTQVRNVHNGN